MKSISGGLALAAGTAVLVVSGALAGCSSGSTAVAADAAATQAGGPSRVGVAEYFSARIAELDPTLTYAVYCRSGNRSQPAVAAVSGAGIDIVYELSSGTGGWTAEGQPLVQ